MPEKPVGISVFHVILHQPQIPPNTGNIIRLCANTGCHLHLIEPLGFELDRRYATLSAGVATLGPARLFAVETGSGRPYSEVSFAAGDAWLFGSETRGLPPAVLAAQAPEHRLSIPMRTGNRSLNLSNAVAVVVYEAWRQLRFGR